MTTDKKLSPSMKTALLGTTVRHGGNNLLIKGVYVREELLKSAAL